MPEKQSVISQGGAMRSDTPDILTTRLLVAEGWSKGRIAAAVEHGRLLRVRRGRYVLPGHADVVVRAARLGGRLDCVSLLRLRGVFVRESATLHLQTDPLASRVPATPPRTVRHWRKSAAPGAAATVDIMEALAQAVRCQSPRDAVATLDSAWHLGLVDETDIDALFARLPLRYRVLRPLLEPRCESGPETLVRLMLRSFGCRVEPQVTIDGVGRVDFVVDGWLVIECDSEAFHSSWAAQKRDRRRDLAAVAAGYVPIRLLAEDVMWRPESVMTALRSILDRGGSFAAA